MLEENIQQEQQQEHEKQEDIQKQEYQIRIDWTPAMYEELKNIIDSEINSGSTKTQAFRIYAKKTEISVSAVSSAWGRYSKKQNKKIDLEEVKIENESDIHEKNIAKLFKYYRSKINHYMQTNEQEGITEMYYWLNTRQVDSCKYIMAAIDIFSRKGDNIKTNFGYLVTIVRNWITYGFGYMPTKEEQVVSDMFEEVLKIKMSPMAKAKLVILISEYGMSKVLFFLGEQYKNISLNEEDISMLYMEKFTKLINEKYQKQ